MNNYKITGMIPARMGSKRIIKKNVRYLGDKPLIQYAIDLALGNESFDSVWVNTENDTLGEIAQRLGAQFHKRPDELANDSATNREFVNEFLLKHDCDYVVMVNTTSPLLRSETIEGFINYIKKNNFDTVLSVIKEQAEIFFEDKPLTFSLKEKINSQLLPPICKVVWSLTAWRREHFLSMQARGENPVFGGKLGLYSIPKDESCDLDSEEDWRIAEGTLRARHELHQSKRYFE
ncbi:CMP-N-acetylneuraminic acid synthetase [Paenibacillus cellulosilyticus]|uniref:CMP-N-acetylneuraminic acid synthetase n=1 Tax=Paenibacillus cellulosilyticus TaxID=375489 RepID=A0A2V2Z0M7_9BACL|nr:acylneuraminate cytidylyltransferase family protein [Paenibacillus cellulosilyticus]PWW08332.1 CMP-N-acetylneuraminic acid synthetase [Paenibacillus cellulosilyticus]QKS47931.1 acylneuraminate cytidylyltransferase family protein [Paenibacillus cellulosilyticus]